MMREKIFRLQRNNPSSGIGAVGEKIDFTFSKFQALQVPKGWDKLYLSLISLETGKTVKKTGKGAVKNGTCQWMETLTESIWISNLDTAKESEKHTFKFLVAMGSSKSIVLGEATLDLAAFLSLEVPSLVSFSLKGCSYGTSLLFEIRCLTPKTNPRDEKWKEMQTNKGKDSDLYEVENMSQISDSTTTRSTESCYSNKFDNASHQRERGSSETSFSSSFSLNGLGSVDDSIGREASSQSPNYCIGRQHLVESCENEPSCSYSSLDPPGLDSKNRRQLRKTPHATTQTLQQNAGLFTKFKEDEGAIVEVLKAEAKMWEQNARKLAIDIENLRNELANQFLNTTNLNMELATSHSECCKLSQEIDQLKLLLEESTKKHIVSGNFEVLGTTSDDMQKQMKDEMRYLKELNENLSSQLKKSQEANLELIGVLQEMEGIIEKQEVEDSVSFLKLVDTKSKNSCINDECREIKVDDQVPIDKVNLDTGVSEIPDIHIDERMLQENEAKSNLESQILEGLEKNFWGEILYLESTFQGKMVENEIEQEVKKLILKEFVMECSFTLAEKEQRILNFKAALSRTQSAPNQKELPLFEASKEIQVLKEKIQELEADCNELTSENLDLLFELKELRNNGSKDTDACFNFLSPESSASDFRYSFTFSEEIRKKEILQERPSELGESINLEIQSQCLKLEASDINNELEECHKKRVDPLEKNHLSELEERNDFLSQRISGLEAQLRYLTDTKESSRLELEHSESQVRVLQNEIEDLEDKLQSQKLGMEKKLSEMEKPWSEAQEECNSLSEVNMRLQVTAENLIKECDSLQNFNAELRQEKLTLQDKCLLLESKVRKFENFVSQEKVETLQGEGEFEDSERDEVKHKPIIDELESKIRYSEIERVRLAEENSVLQMQLAKAPELQNEVLTLRLSLKEMKSENQILEAALKSVSGDYEELKRENNSKARKISSMQNMMSEAEDCRRKKIMLEEKILRLEGDLIANDALHAMDAEIKGENNRVKRENNLLNLELKNLGDIREELQKKVQCLEEELKQTKNAKECQRECICTANDEHKITLLEAELQELRERYLQISLKYAEVEAHKEQLVMKVKALNTWNSFPK